MNKTWLIVKREFLNRVRNKAFLFLTFLAPFFYGILLVLPILTSKWGKDIKTVLLKDESKLFSSELKNNKQVHFIITTESESELQEEIKHDKENRYLLIIPADLDIYHPKDIALISKKNVSSSFKSYLDSLLAAQIRILKMRDLKLTSAVLDSLNTKVDVELKTITVKGLVNSNSTATTIAAASGGFLIYIFIFLYGGMVLRGVQEEKQNRVVEVMISSVKPFQLMMGKIVGIALVGLAQFLIWVVLTLIFTVIAGAFMGAIPPADASGVSSESLQGGHLLFQQAQSAFNTLNIPLLVSMFVFYFIGGYLLYSSLFAALAAAVDSNTDVYQFMFPISLPIIISIALVPAILHNPESNFAFWLSVIPFTSPIIMMARLPFIEPGWDLLLSMLLLIAGFIFTTWLAAKIYRIGILMYGKKITYREIMRWMFYKA